MFLQRLRVLLLLVGVLALTSQAHADYWKVEFRALIDGRSRLIVTGASTVFWQHFAHGRPGQNGGSIEPTYINFYRNNELILEDEWYPDWFKGTVDSSHYTGFPFKLPTPGLYEYGWRMDSGRGTFKVQENNTPSAILDDSDPDGRD